MRSATPQRVIALGASNLTRGFYTIVSTARRAWGPDVEILAALGHGRSYGSESRFVVRTLPGILQSGLWDRLATLPPATTRAIVSDVGNDILYGFSPAQILSWVDESIGRLQDHSTDIVLSGLPRVGMDDISGAKFLFFRSILFPRCRLTFAEVADAAARVNEGLARLAEARSARFVHLKPEWYGVDPIHIRPSHWWAAWQEILSAAPRDARVEDSTIEGLRLYLMRPERQWLCGVAQVTPQTGVRLPAGGKVWLY